jgi:site-specific recombinase XerD
MHRALLEVDTDAADLAHFLVASGWRWSEAIALPVSAIEVAGAVTYVNMRQVMRRSSQGNRIEQGGKSAAALRRTSLDPAAAAMLARRSEGLAGADLVLTSAGHPWGYSTFVRRAWAPAVVAAGLADRKPTPHWLRHTSVFFLLSAGNANLAQMPPL